MVTKSMLCALILSSVQVAVQASPALTLTEAVALATRDEPGVSARLAEASALQHQSVSSGQLPDPNLQLGAVNVPTDTFNLDQDPMTQLKLGVSQKFTPGGSRDRQQAVYSERAEAVRFAASDRRLQVKQQTRLAWLEIYYGRVAVDILDKHRRVLEQLRRFVGSLYETGRTNQQDITRVEVELSRLSERRIALDRDTGSWRARLGQWLGEDAWRPLAPALPDWQLPAGERDREQLAESLVAHPAVRAMDHQVEASQQQVEVHRQSYKPEWGVNVSYGHRSADDPAGGTRPDLLSAVVSVSLPLFTGSRQDRQVETSLQRSSAVQNSRRDLLYRMRGELWGELTRAQQYQRQLDLYQHSILTRLQQQADSALASYQADMTDFSEVMRSTLARLDGELDFQRVRIDRLKTLARLNYYLADAGPAAEEIP